MDDCGGFRLWFSNCFADGLVVDVPNPVCTADVCTVAFVKRNVWSSAGFSLNWTLSGLSNASCSPQARSAGLSFLGNVLRL